MLIDKPRCNFKKCRYCFDSNCSSADKYETCELTDLKHEIAKSEGGWISVDERLPGAEVEVLVMIGRKFRNLDYPIITTAMYEDGTVSTEDSFWCWYDLDFDYDEENDRYLIPKGWWEYRHYNPDDVFNNLIDDEVTHWMPLPEAPKGGDE